MYFNNPAFLPIAYFYYFFIIFYIVLFCVSLNYLLQKEMIFATFVFSLPTSFVYGCLTTFIVHLSLPLRFFLMGGASSGANKMAFQNGTCQHQCSYHRIISLQPLLMSMPLEWASIASSLPGWLSRGASDPGSFQILASALDPKVCEDFVCTL